MTPTKQAKNLVDLVGGGLAAIGAAATTTVIPKFNRDLTSSHNFFIY